MMQLKKTISAFLLLLLFAFPIAYMPLHIIVSHPTQQTSECNHHCACEVTVNSDTHSNNEQADTIKPSADHCAVCEYELALYRQTVVADFGACLPVMNAVLNTGYSFTHTLFAGYHFKLRGPPMA
jgi:hypothetical protein